MIPEVRFEGFDSEWEELNLGKNSIIFAGGTPSTKIASYWEPKEVPWLSSGEVHKKYIYNTDNKISIKGLNNSSASWIKPNSVLIALAGQGKTRGTVAVNKIALTANQSIGAIEPNKKIHYKFLFNNLENRYEELRLMSTGDGGRGGLNNEIISKINIISPINIEEQKKVGSYFERLDKDIAFKQSGITKLKNFKQAMLQKMFPKEGEKEPEIRFEGFSGEWMVHKLKDLGTTFTSLSGKTKEDFGHGNAEFVTYMNVFSNTVAKSNQTDKIEIDPKQSEVQYGDIFFTTSSETPEEVGMSSVWVHDKKNVYLNSFCFGYRPYQKMNPYYMAYMLRAPVIRDKFIVLAQGISRYNISKIKAMEISIYLPADDEQIAIGNFFKELDNKIGLEEQNLEKMKQFKKAMLQKMFV